MTASDVNITCPRRACILSLILFPSAAAVFPAAGENPSRNGVVSRSDNMKPAEEEGARPLANGLFIELLPQ
jgi:hypothetical protein